jgi:hypothetical protein
MASKNTANPTRKEIRLSPGQEEKQEALAILYQMENLLDKKKALDEHLILAHFVKQGLKRINEGEINSPDFIALSNNLESHDAATNEILLREIAKYREKIETIVPSGFRTATARKIPFRAITKVRGAIDQLNPFKKGVQ